MLTEYKNGMTESDMRNYIRTMIPGISYSDMWSIRNRFVYDLVPLDKAVEEYYENNQENS